MKKNTSPECQHGSIQHVSKSIKGRSERSSMTANQTSKEQPRRHVCDYTSITIITTVWPRTWEFSVISEPVRSQQSGTCYACKRPVTENNINIALATNCIKVILIGWQVNSNLRSKGSGHTSMSTVLWQSPHWQKKKHSTSTQDEPFLIKLSITWTQMGWHVKSE